MATPGEADVLSAREAKDVRFRAEGEESAIPADLLDEFSGLEYYAFDPGWQYVVRLERHEEPEPFVMTTTAGEQRPAVKVGSVSFQRDGTAHTLQVYSLRDVPASAWNSLFLPFMDATTGEETYGAGRYVELEKVGEDWYLLDFNQAYNPLCAYGRDIYVCPRAPAENRLAIPVRAGERGWGVPGARDAAGATDVARAKENER